MPPPPQKSRRARVEAAIDDGSHASKELIAIYRLAYDIIDNAVVGDCKGFPLARSLVDEIEGIAIDRTAQQDEEAA